MNLSNVNPRIHSLKFINLIKPIIIKPITINKSIDNFKLSVNINNC